MVSKLKVTSVASLVDFSSVSTQDLCGFEFTSKLQRMFNDITLSIELLRQFHESQVEQSPSNLLRLNST